MIRSILLAIFLLIVGAGTANARDDGTCTPESAGIVFGSFTGSEIEAIGSILLSCRGSGRLKYRVTLSTGAGSYDVRQMTQVTNHLAYNLYSDPRHRTIWGDGTGDSRDVRGSVGFRGEAVHPEIVSVYALLPAAEPPAVGPYLDTIVASVTTDDGTFSSTFPVTAVSTPACTIFATNLAFPDYGGSQVDGQSQISVNCNPFLFWSVGLSPGSFPGATATSRRMTGPGTSSLDYSLYRNAARTQNWGNNRGVDTVQGIGTGHVQTIGVFGRIPPAQSAPTGGYLDRIVATVSF